MDPASWPGGRNSGEGPFFLPAAIELCIMENWDNQLFVKEKKTKKYKVLFLVIVHKL